MPAGWDILEQYGTSRPEKQRTISVLPVGWKSISMTGSRQLWELGWGRSHCRTALPYMHRERDGFTHTVPELSLSDAEYARRNLIPGETTFALDGRTFRVSKLEPDIGRVELQDVTFANAVGFPIFQVEPNFSSHVSIWSRNQSLTSYRARNSG